MMHDYCDPKIRILLTEEARSKVQISRRGKHNEYADHRIGMTNIHIEKGLMFAQVDWGIDGLDMPVSPEIEQFVSTYSIEWGEGPNSLAEGIYKLCKGKNVLASARVRRREVCRGAFKTDIMVTSKKRGYAVQLFELVRTGKLRPAVEVEEFKQIEGGLGELNRLRRQVPALQTKLSDKDKVNAELQKRLREARQQLQGVQQLMAA